MLHILIDETCFAFPLQRIENNWRTGRHELQKIQCLSETSKGVYCLQYDDNKIISGLRDNTIKVVMISFIDMFQRNTKLKIVYGFFQMNENLVLMRMQEPMDKCVALSRV